MKYLYRKSALKTLSEPLCLELIDTVILKKIPQALHDLLSPSPHPAPPPVAETTKEITHPFKVIATVTFYWKVEKKNGGWYLGERTDLWPLDLKVESECKYFFTSALEEKYYLVGFTEERGCRLLCVCIDS